MNPIRIIDYLPEHQPNFESLNRRWIEKYFKMETKDIQSLTHPQETILDPGGAILIALYNEEIAGTVALQKVDDTTFEFTKMGVDPQFQRKGIAEKLSYASYRKAMELGAEVIILYSNSVLKPAIALYEKIGFKHVPITYSGYIRADVKMEIPIEEALKIAEENELTIYT